MDNLTASEASTYSREEMEALRDSLTMLDIYKARKATKTAVDTGLFAYWEAAKRTGLIASTTTLEDFLGRLSAHDFNEIMGAGPRPNEIGGGSAEASSDGTD